MIHNFDQFPELTNAQIQAGIRSPFPQITKDIRAEVVKVHDGDTITVRWDRRDFDFPVRLHDIDAPELNEPKGETAKEFLSNRILGRTVWIRIREKNRVDKWGRLLGTIEYAGLNINELLLTFHMVKSFEQRDEGKIRSLKELYAST